MDDSILIIPRPPSVNQCFGNRRTGDKGRGRYITPAYAEWRARAGKAIMAAGRMPRFAGAVEIEVRATDPDDNRERDGDNLMKPTLDLLVSLGIIMGDGRKIVRKCSVAWGEGLPDSIAVFIRKADDLPEDPKYKRKDRHGKAWALKQLKRKFGIDIAPERVHLQ